MNEIVRYVQVELRKFYEKYGRDFPWRYTTDPYGIMVAEFMLQRTKAEQVSPIYKKFIEKYPDVFKLSSARPEDIQNILFSLGLHWRLHHFIDAAKYIVNKFDGKFPSKREDLMQIPGIGDYVAGAILVVAFGKSEYVVDSNIARFINRFFGLLQKGEIRRNKRIKVLSKEIFSCNNPKEILFSLLDFTALICTPQKPKCDTCQLKNNCKHYQKKQVNNMVCGPANSLKAFGFLALAMLGATNKRICGSFRSPKPPAVASHIRNTLSEIARRQIKLPTESRG